MGPIKIFYAWQSDTSTALNKRFIHEAADAAIAILNENVTIEDAPAFGVELDHDTKDVPGSPIVAEEICNKIDACDLFLADMSLVARYTKPDGKTHKWTPNPNVLIEYGYARRTKGIKRIIGVNNDGTLDKLGEPKGGMDNLPFDLAHIRFPITYNLTDTKDEAKVAAKKKELSDALVNAFRLALKPVFEQRKAEQESERARRNELVKTRVTAIRTTFENRLPNGGFRGFSGQGAQPVFALSIIPLEPIPEPIDVVGRQDEIFQRFRPMTGSGWHPATEPGSAWVTTRIDTQGRVIHDSVAEITSNGEIFAAMAIFYDPPANPTTRAVIDFVYVERDIFIAVEGFLHLLRTDLNIYQELAVCLSLYGARNFLLKPTGKYHLAEVRPVASNEIMCPPDFIKSSVVALDRKDASILIRNGFNYLWQTCGLKFDPHIQQSP
jgi:hypothetical protein